MKAKSSNQTWTKGFVKNDIEEWQKFGQTILIYQKHRRKLCCYIKTFEFLIANKLSFIDVWGWGRDSR